MQTLKEIRALLAERGLHPRKRFGQNFLHDQNHLRRLVAAAAIEPGDVVLEVGPGTGTLTEALLEVGARVIAAEIDLDLAEIIESRLGSSVTLVRGDCLDGRHLAPALVEALDGAPFHLVANLPYQIASSLMVGLLLEHPECRGQHITIQKEVVDRLVAGPGSKTYGPLGIIVQSMADVERIGNLPASCFWPAPKVTSAMATIRPASEARVSNPAGFARFVTAVFSRRRKQLGTIFGRDVVLPEGIDPMARPEVLSVAQLIELFETVPLRDAGASRRE